MPLFSINGHSPQVHEDAFVAPTATLIGDVVVEAGASVWYGAVLRGDCCSIRVSEGANVQDGAVLHAAQDEVVHVGRDVTVAHLCVVHGAYLEDGCLVANGCVVLDGARIGAGSLVAAGSVVSSGFKVPPGVLVAGAPASIKRELQGTAAAELVSSNGPAYRQLAEVHRTGLVATGV